MQVRLVGYKNVKPVIEAFALLPEAQLVVAGSGPEEKSLRAIAGHNVTFAGRVSDDEMRRLMATARALIFAAEEDFGIVPVEALAEGTPVIALGRGGVRESVITFGPNPTGIFFDRPDAVSIAAALNEFLATAHRFSPAACREQALKFSAAQFRRQFSRFANAELYEARNHVLAARPMVAAASHAEAAE